MKFIFLISLLVFFHTSFAQDLANNKSFTLKGKVATNQTGYLWLRYTDKDGKDILDSAYLNNGNFIFTGSVNGGTPASLRFLHKSLGVDDPNFTSLFIESTNMTIEAKENEFKQAKITGSKIQDENEQLEKSKKEWLQREQTLNLELKALDKSVQDKDTLLGASKKLESIQLALRYTLNQLKQLDLSFINENRNSYLSPYVLRSYISNRNLSIDTIEHLFNRFTNQVQHSNVGKFTMNLIHGVKSSMLGAAAPSFSLKTADGRQIELQDFKGKNYVLLDFWASWCVPCREMTPKLKQIYSQYRPMGLDIVSISVDMNKKAWLKAVAEEQTPWHQLLDPIAYQTGGSWINYAIPSIPLLLLIDKKGIIIGRYENGDLTPLDQKLKEIF